MSTKQHQGRLILEAASGMHGDVAKELSEILCRTLEQRTDYEERLREIAAWAVCAPIATAEDMMQNIPRIVEVSTLPEREITPSSRWHLNLHYWETKDNFDAAQEALRLSVESINQAISYNLLPDAPSAALRAASRAAKDSLRNYREETVGDPHDMRFDIERAQLALGSLTDDELANGVFMNYDVRPDLGAIIAGRAHSPIAWVTAAKERIRWLSRSLQAQLAEVKALTLQRDNFKFAFDEWMAKIDWLKPSVKELGMHYADILTKRYRVHEGLLEDARLAVLANHEHHLSYDDHDGYAGSELYEQNYRFLKSVGCDVPQEVLDAALEKSLTLHWGLNLIQVDKLKANCLKPEEIASDSKEVAAQRVSELLHWMARFADGNANPKWLKAHAFELAYRLATQTFQSNVDWHKFGQESFLQGLNCSGSDRALLQQLGQATIPSVWFNEQGEIQGTVSDEQLDTLCRAAIVVLRNRTSALSEPPIWSYRRYGSPPEQGYTIVSKRYSWEPNGVPIAYLGDSPEVGKAIHELCEAHNRQIVAK